MNPSINRRFFIRSSATASALLGLHELSLFSKLGSVSAAEARLPENAVQMRPEIEPVVRFLEDTPRERLLEEVAHRIRHGLSYRDVLAALLLAGVRNIQPRPVGFKFHAVLVVNSAHLASINSPDSERWLPVFWALDYFKSSQERDVQEGNWTMSRVDESKVPTPRNAKRAFIGAMDKWDVEAADHAVPGLVRSLGAGEVFDLFSLYGSRDYRDIGHKAIYVANSFRTLQCIGWEHAEPVLRSLAYALLAHEGGNPAERDASPDRPGRRNLERAASIVEDWKAGELRSSVATDLLETFRHASPNEASDRVIRLLAEKTHPQSIWDGIFSFVGELLMRNPGIVSLHAATCSNAMHYSFQNCGDDRTRRMLLLQNAAFLPMFRGGTLNSNDQALDQIRPDEVSKDESKAVEDLFSEIEKNRLGAARKALGYFEAGHSAKEFINTARRCIFLKGSNSHDYKFSSAVLEDYYHVSPAWRNRYLAASVFNLRGSQGADNGLVGRTRAALEA
ncbi:MAG: hypothetical protein O2960_17700 [Verrucomicrobia bacterium]|nr:hypothetical protein [Verrucomicrobiota bacterium]